MPRKARLPTSYPKHFFALIEGATVRPLHIPTGSLKEAQYIVAELNQFRVSLRSSLDPFYPMAERITISARGDTTSGEIYMRTQEAEWSALAEAALLTKEELAKGEEHVERIRQEAEEIERKQLGAPQPSQPSVDPFDRAMEMLKKGE